MAINHKRAVMVNDAQIESLYRRLVQGACTACGATPITTGERRLLAELVNKYGGIETVAPPEAAIPIKSARKFDHPVSDAAPIEKKA